MLAYLLLASMPAAPARGAYCAASGNCGSEWIDTVQIGSIDNSFTGCDNYADYTAISTTLEKGGSYEILVVNGGNWFGDQCGIWVDWNHDQDFTDAGETITISGGPLEFTAVITPPAGAVLGSTRMRIRIMYTGTLSPCGTVDYGEVEDYTIVVAEPAGGYCGAGGGGAEYIELVQVGAIYNVSSFSGYADYTGLSTTMERETGYLIVVTNGGSAYLGDQCGIWVDWNHDEDFADAGEFFSTSNPNGEIWTFSGSITPPAGALLGDTRMRVRLMYTGTLTPCGSTDEGEVEDYTITVVPPATGYCEASGQCGEYIGVVQVGTINKTSGCINYADYTSVSTTMQRSTAYPIIVTNTGSVYAGDQCGIWVDWNQDDDFEDAAEFFSTSTSGGGVFTASITPPAGATLGETRMRIRVTYTTPLSSCGPDAFGEVEDYTINVAPAAADYCTASGGCREQISSVQLRTIDNTSEACTGYTNYTHISTTVEKGSSYPVTVANDGEAYAGDQCGIWVDWNQDNDFEDANEQIATAGGPFSFDANLSPPLTALEGPTRMRIRIMYTGPPSACGPTSFGEVEDYTLNVVSPVATYCAASGGCAEYIGSVQVGTISNTSTGCNNYANYTHLATEMAISAAYPITVTNDGSTYAGDQCGIWIDWNQDQDFDDANEAISTTGGPVTFTGTITPPMSASLGDTRMRVRIRNAGALEPCGAPAVGEVEDYTVTVVPIIGDFVSPIGVDFKDYAVLAGQWQLPPGEPSADIAPQGGDNIVDGLDLAALAQNWLLAPE